MYRKIRGNDMEMFTRFRWATDGLGTVWCKYGRLLQNNRAGEWEFRNSYEPHSWVSFYSQHAGEVPDDRNFKKVLRSAEKLMLRYRRHRWYRRIFILILILSAVSAFWYWGYLTDRLIVPEFMQKLLGQ